jgi:hypothetical protein
MFSHLVRVAAGAALLIAACVAPASGQQIIAVTEFTTNLSEAEVRAVSGPDAAVSGITRGLSDTMLTDLVQLLDEPEFSKCGAHVVEWTRIDEVHKEREFSKSKYVDPASVGEGEIIEPNRFVTGHVSAAGSGVAWLVELAGPSGVVARITGEGTLQDLAARTAEIARQLLDKACERRAVHITAGLNDLEIDEDVCDLTQPFTLSGRGASTGIVLEMTPATAEGGSFVVTGAAAGVTWSGGGEYQIAMIEGQEMIGLDGTWSITSPMGVFSDSDTIPGKVTTIENCAQ